MVITELIATIILLNFNNKLLKHTNIKHMFFAQHRAGFDGLTD